MQHDVQHGIEGARRELLGAADEVAGGVVHQPGQWTALIPDALHHSVHGLRIAHVADQRMHPRAGCRADVGGGTVQDGLPTAADEDFRTE